MRSTRWAAERVRNHSSRQVETGQGGCSSECEDLGRVGGGSFPLLLEEAERILMLLQSMLCISRHIVVVLVP